MSGVSSGRGSGRAHFRSKSGCCICGTKSSSSRFTASERYAEHFGACFDESAANRKGDLCNACVLCVKRWLSRGQEPGRFKQVLDSKLGPGPKHMKEIAKRARRREARKHQLQVHANLQRQSLRSRLSSLTAPTTSTPKRHHHQHHHHHHTNSTADDTGTSSVTGVVTSTPTSAAAAAASLGSNGNGTGSGGDGGASIMSAPSATTVVRTRSSVSRRTDPSTRSAGSSLATDLDSVTRGNASSNSGFADVSSGESPIPRTRSVANSNNTAAASTASNAVVSRSGNGGVVGGGTSSGSSFFYSHQRQNNSSGPSAASAASGIFNAQSGSDASPGLHFRPPRPPTVGANGGGRGVVTRAAAQAFSSFYFWKSMAAADGASSTASSTTSTPSTPTRRHNRRTRLPPVKIPTTAVEVNDILGHLESDSSMSLDSRQINMAMQRQIRLRNRIVNSGYVSAASAAASSSTNSTAQSGAPLPSANTTAASAAANNSGAASAGQPTSPSSAV